VKTILDTNVLSVRSLAIAVKTHQPRRLPFDPQHLAGGRSGPEALDAGRKVLASAAGPLLRVPLELALLNPAVRRLPRHGSSPLGLRCLRADCDKRGGPRCSAF
jgi:hypothetical protein